MLSANLTNIPITPHFPLDIKTVVWSHPDVQYTPSGYAVPFHQSQAHVRVVYGGWRAGKSFSSAMEVLPYPLFWKDQNRGDDYNGVIWIIGPEFYQARAEFRVLEKYLLRLGYLDPKDVSKPKDGRWSMTTSTNWLIETQSSRHMESLGAVTVNAVIIAEAGQHESGILNWAMGRVAESHGPIICSGTLEDSGQWYSDLFYKYPAYPNPADIQTFSLPTWSNPKFGREDHPHLRQIKALTPPREWRVKYCGVPAPPKGVVFPEFCPRPRTVYDDVESDVAVSVENICHVSDVAEYNPALPVVLFVDPGEVYTVLAGQWVSMVHTRRDTGQDFVTPGLFVFDEISIPHGHFDQVRAELLNKPYRFHITHSYHDRATIQHHNQKSQADLWRMPVDQGGLSIPVMYSARVLGISDGVSLMHRWLINPLSGEPLVYLHPRCEQAIAELQKERYPRDRQNQATPLPLDVDNHARKALCYGIFYQYGVHLPVEKAVKQRLYTTAVTHKYGY